MVRPAECVSGGTDQAFGFLKGCLGSALRPLVPLLSLEPRMDLLPYFGGFSARMPTPPAKSRPIRASAIPFDGRGVKPGIQLDLHMRQLR